ncbi:glycosyltransferase [Roseobacter sp. HKCCA0434]|uniref:glycosyltransferase n=1 Tax=Roseobacter sp. HKCCA0434 TaxID=3079297 RepID=UPI002905D8DB|nr:glycosyltransferase [Roseobacter sp. HKCCA0434]
MRRVVHLVDDTGPGGVTRLLDHIRSDTDMAAIGRHEVVVVRGGLSAPPRLPLADVIVSHVVLSWRNLPFFAALRARYARLPIIHVEHSYSPAFVALHVTNRKRFRAMLTASLSLFDRVVSISTAQRDWLVPFAGLAEGKAVLLPPYVDIARFLALRAPAGDVRRIGALGRLDPQKGFDILIRAFSDADPAGVQLEIFGEGPERAYLEELAKDHPRIRFHGHVSDPVAAMGRVDAIAMPSRREPYGLVALEALAAGRPLLVSRADGLQDHALNGAIAVDRLCVEDWSAALTRVTSEDNAMRAQLARWRVADAGERFAQGWRRLLDEVA